MEIERKWMVNSWPQNLTLKDEYTMRQGYLCTKPTVRIRSEAKTGGETQFVLCVKGKADKNRMAREEIETLITAEAFEGMERIIGLPLIEKLRRDYLLPDGLTLEVSIVDAGSPTEFCYAEVEFATIEQAESWNPKSAGLEHYLNDEVTSLPGQSMATYWRQTRLGE